MSVRNELREYIFSLPVVDTHAHLREYSSLPQSMSALALFNSSGNLRQMWVSSGALSVSEYRQMKQFQDWGGLSAAIEKIKASGIYRIFWRGLRDLYGVCAEELDEDSFNELSEKVCAAYGSYEWYHIVIRERAGVELTCQDSRNVSDRSLFTPVARFDEYVWFARADWRTRVLQRHGTEKTATLDGLLHCLEEDFRSAVDSGAAAVKNNSNWCRLIDFDAVSKQEAERAFAECLGESSSDEQVEKILGIILWITFVSFARSMTYRFSSTRVRPVAPVTWSNGAIRFI
ncbi:MAG: hypothetical protein ACUVRS_10025 [Armatimonadota bacterium]